MWSLRLVLALVLGTATLISTSAVLHLKSDGFQAHLESHAPVLVDCKWYRQFTIKSIINGRI
jgi:hypothetical protein